MRKQLPRQTVTSYSPAKDGAKSACSVCAAPRLRSLRVVHGAPAPRGVWSVPAVLGGGGRGLGTEVWQGAGRGGLGTVLGGPLEVLDHGVVVDAAQHLLLDQAKLLARGQLALARKASEAGQMVGIAACPPHPVAGIDLSTAPCTLGPKSAAGHRDRKGGWRGSDRLPLPPPNPSGPPAPCLLAFVHPQISLCLDPPSTPHPCRHQLTFTLRR